MQRSVYSFKFEVQVLTSNVFRYELCHVSTRLEHECLSCVHNWEENDGTCLTQGMRIRCSNQIQNGRTILRDNGITLQGKNIHNPLREWHKSWLTGFSVTSRTITTLEENILWLTQTQPWKDCLSIPLFKSLALGLGLVRQLSWLHHKSVYTMQTLLNTQVISSAQLS